MFVLSWSFHDYQVHSLVRQTGKSVEKKIICHSTENMSRLMTKPTKWLSPAKTQISLGIRPVWSESSLSAGRKLGSLATHWAHGEDSDQTGRMSRLIWVFAGRTGHIVGFVMRWLNSQLNLFVCGVRFYMWLWFVWGYLGYHPLLAKSCSSGTPQALCRVPFLDFCFFSIWI